MTDLWLCVAHSWKCSDYLYEPFRLFRLDRKMMEGIFVIDYKLKSQEKAEEGSRAQLKIPKEPN